MTERKGNLMRWQADCGHWMVVYSLEPTPKQCPDCADKGHDLVARWESDVCTAESSASDVVIEVVADYFSTEGVELADEHVQELQRISDRCREAYGLLSEAQADLWRFLQSSMPAVERLTMPEAS